MGEDAPSDGADEIERLYPSPEGKLVAVEIRAIDQRFGLHEFTIWTAVPQQVIEETLLNALNAMGLRDRFRRLAFRRGGFDFELICTFGQAKKISRLIRSDHFTTAVTITLPSPPPLWKNALT